jgi:hypothetical protein
MNEMHDESTGQIKDQQWRYTSGMRLMGHCLDSGNVGLLGAEAIAHGVEAITLGYGCLSSLPPSELMSS